MKITAKTTFCGPLLGHARPREMAIEIYYRNMPDMGVLNFAFFFRCAVRAIFVNMIRHFLRDK